MHPSWMWVQEDRLPIGTNETCPKQARTRKLSMHGVRKGVFISHVHANTQEKSPRIPGQRKVIRGVEEIGEGMVEL